MSAVALAVGMAVAALGMWWRWRLLPARPVPPPPSRRPGRRRTAPPSAAEWAALLDTAAADVRAGASLTSAWHDALLRHPLHGAVVRPGRSPAAVASGVAPPHGQPGATGIAGRTRRAGRDRPAGLAGDARRARRAGPGGDEAVVLQVIGAAVELGGPVAATLDAGASLLREREAARAEAVAHSAQARLSARVLTGVPLVFAGWSMASSASFRAAVGTPAGVAAAIAGAVLNLLGWWWMRRVVAGASR